MTLWLDKHRPTSLCRLDFHLEGAAILKNSGDFPHLLFYGPPGSGKKTRITCLLRELYGPGVDKLRIEHHTFLTPSKKKVELSTASSNYHLEVNPSDVGIYDRIVIQELIKNMASTAQLESVHQREFKVVVIHEVDRLTRDAQHSLRRTMEKYMQTCRLILCAESLSKIIPAARSRCLSVRVPAPTVDEIASVLTSVAKREGLKIPPELAARIAIASDRNLRRSLLLAEVARVQHYPMQPDQSIPLPEWQTFIVETAAAILGEQSPRRILDVRTKLYELLAHCIPPDVIMKGLVDNLLTSCDGSLKLELVRLAAMHEHRLQLGQKAIFHLEAFVIAFMAIYKRFVEDALGGTEW
ncbi:unnamed protein product [Schistocephalus solidus]|uniref:Replication factor C subunit 3 n=1 Tax=Schistocephalus solidus TaxID=70667 RepID=A0A183SYB5_SCHSO|nr:unnamed protein product [Schistocephalus solidus]